MLKMRNKLFLQILSYSIWRLRCLYLNTTIRNQELELSDLLFTNIIYLIYQNRSIRVNHILYTKMNGFRKKIRSCYILPMRNISGVFGLGSLRNFREEDSSQTLCMNYLSNYSLLSSSYQSNCGFSSIK